jgi:hypothetical protein
MKQTDIQDVANSFRTLDDIYIEIEKGNLDVLSRELATNNYPQIKWLIDYFLKIEDYNKIVFLQKLKLPQISQERINLEKKYQDILKKGYYKGFRDDFEKELKELKNK